MNINSNKLLEIFCSYALADEKLLRQLENHLSILQRQGKIAPWHTGHLLPGQDISEEILEHLNSAQIILLLISPDFCASDQNWEIEMGRALERQKEEKTLVIPVLLRPVYHQGSPFDHLPLLPKNGKPVTTWRNQDEAFEDIVRNILLFAEQFEKTQRVSWKEIGVGVSLATAISTLIPSDAPGPSKPAKPTIGSQAPLPTSTTTLTPAQSGATITFNALGGSSNVILVYPGVGNTPQDKRHSGAYYSGTTVPIVCETEGRTIVSHPADGQQYRQSNVWYKLQTPPNTRPQYATAVYADKHSSVPRC